MTGTYLVRLLVAMNGVDCLIKISGVILLLNKLFQIIGTMLAILRSVLPLAIMQTIVEQCYTYVLIEIPGFSKFGTYEGNSKVPTDL